MPPATAHVPAGSPSVLAALLRRRGMYACSGRFGSILCWGNACGQTRWEVASHGDCRGTLTCPLSYRHPMCSRHRQGQAYIQDDECLGSGRLLPSAWRGCVALCLTPGDRDSQV